MSDDVQSSSRKAGASLHGPVGMDLSVLEIFPDQGKQGLNFDDRPAQASREGHETESLDGLQEILLGPRAYLSVNTRQEQKVLSASLPSSLCLGSLGQGLMGHLNST